MHDQDRAAAPLPVTLAALLQHVSHETSDTPAAAQEQWSHLSNLIYEAQLVIRYATVMQITPDALVYPKLLSEHIARLNQEYIQYLRGLDPAILQEHLKQL